MNSLRLKISLMLLSVTVGTILARSHSSSSESGSDEEDARASILAAIKTIQNALNAGDAATVARQHTVDAVTYTPTTEVGVCNDVNKGRALIKDNSEQLSFILVLANDFLNVPESRTIVEVHDDGESAISFEWWERVDRDTGERKFPTTVRAMVQWVKKGGVWLVHRGSFALCEESA